MSAKKLSVKKSATSKDVAKLAGVSQSTVSRVFNTAGGYGVKDSLRERVLAAARELEYRPNLVASGMSSGKTNIVGLVVGESLGPFYNSVVSRFTKKIQDIGKQCLIFKIPRQNEIDHIIEKVIQFQVDAVIITASAITKVLTETIVNDDIPVVLFNRFIPDINTSIVYIDPIEGARLAAEYFYSKGHRNIGYIQFFHETGEEMEKKVGFYSKLREHGIFQIQEEKSDYDYKEGYAAGLRMLSAANPPTAIFCTSDLIAMGVVDAARHELGLRIPEDLAVIGYDDVEMASWKAYDLTTIHQPVEEAIDETVSIIEKTLNEDEKSVEIKMLKPTLRKRGTV